jgi:hypothetical protein
VEAAFQQIIELPVSDLSFASGSRAQQHPREQARRGETGNCDQRTFIRRLKFSATLTHVGIFRPLIFRSAFTVADGKLEDLGQM